MSRPSPDQVAHHESGHAASYLCLGPDRAGIILLVIHPTGGGLCRARYRRLSLDEHLCVFLSGPCAELRHIRGPDWHATEADLNEARSVTSGDISDALDLLGGDAAALWVHWQRSGEFVGRHWDGITLLAEVLRHYGQLDGEQVEEIWRGTEGRGRECNLVWRGQCGTIRPGVGKHYPKRFG